MKPYCKIPLGQARVGSDQGEFMKLFNYCRYSTQIALCGLLLATGLWGCESQDPARQMAPIKKNIPLKTVVLGIEGMVCDACAQSISTALLKLNGVQECTTSFAEKSARIAFAPEKIQIEEISLTVQSLGYQPGSVRTSGEPTKRPPAVGGPPMAKDSASPAP